MRRYPIFQKEPPMPPLSVKKNGMAPYFRILSVLAITLLGGCSKMVLLHPRGPVGDTEKFVILTAFALMLIVVIPAIIMALWFPRKYRASSIEETYTPKWSHSVRIELIIWLVPAVIVTSLAVLIWITTHRLDPYKPLHSKAKPINIEVVSLDWKWLFIYPDSNIAVVNQLVFPANVPLSFKITSDTVMTSFFIPQLGSQIYGMAGMQTRLHLMADTVGTYDGHNQQFSGSGYADMNFKAITVSPEEFEAWVQKVQKSPQKLDLARYEELEKPSSKSPVTYFSSVEPNLFGNIMGKYNKAMAKGSGTQEAMPLHNMNPEGH